MNIALVFAGGSGIRMNSNAKPKQFLQVYGKEIIIHTLEHFEKHSEITAIVVVCIESWIPFLQELLTKYNIKKTALVSGGKTGQESIYKGLCIIKQQFPPDSVVLIHDGVRPFITAELISSCIESVTRYGSAITVTPAIETIVSIDSDKTVSAIYERKSSFYAKAPQCFRFQDIWNCHIQALKEGVIDAIDSASLMMRYGYSLHTVIGSYDNIKITTPTDFYVCKALFGAKENTQVFGI